jgi:predicted transcriptional regulator
MFAQNRPSKLEMCLEILTILEQNPTLKKKQIADRTEIGTSDLVWAMDFLATNGYIEYKKVTNQKLFCNTPKGFRLEKRFKMENQLADALRDLSDLEK